MTDTRIGNGASTTPRQTVADWLSALDALFLHSESPTSHMHVAVTAVFHGGSVSRCDGSVDIDRIRAYIASRLHHIPRYRQKLAYSPVWRRPVWVDDAHFNVAYHVRHASLPRPGDERQLQLLAGRIKSQQLDRQKPLWEVWVVEGLADGGFALISKTHHCMIDGLSGADLLAVLLQAEPCTSIGPEAPFAPAHPPGWLAFVRDELGRQLAGPLAAAAHVARDPGIAWRTVRDGVQALAGTAAALWPASSTPFNRPIGPHRRFAWWTLDLARAKSVKDTLGGTLNDVVLATVAGAMRRILPEYGTQTHGMDLRALVPVSTRRDDEQGQLGNRVSAWIVPLPIDMADPRRRLRAVAEDTHRLKDTNQALGAAALSSVSEWTGPAFLSAAVQLAMSTRPFNVVVTNVPGPPMPLYLLGATMTAVYPQVPLFQNQGLGIALFSYHGALHWGFNTDWDVGPDPHEFAAATEAAFDELYAAARLQRARVQDHGAESATRVPAPPPVPIVADTRRQLAS